MHFQLIIAFTPGKEGRGIYNWVHLFVCPCTYLNFGYPRLTLNEGPKVKSDHTKRFPAHDFLCVALQSQTSRTKNKLVISTFKFGYLRLTLKEGPKVKSDHTRGFPAHDFLCVGLPSQTSRTNNKRVISTFMFGYPHLTLNEGSKVKSDHIRRFTAHDFL